MHGSLRTAIVAAAAALLASWPGHAGNVVTKPHDGSDGMEGIAYTLPAIYARIVVERKKDPTGPGMVEKITLQLDPPVADPAHRYMLILDHSMMRDDTWSITTTPAGLLTSAKATAANRLGDILVELSRFAGAAAAQTVSPGSSGGRSVMGEACDGPAGPFRYERVFDLSAPPSAVAPAVSAAAVNAELCRLGSSYKLNAVAMAPLQAETTAKDPKRPKSYDGVLYRRPQPYRVDIVTCMPDGPGAGCSMTIPNGAQAPDGAVLGEGEYVADSRIVLIPNRAPVVVLPYESLLFVTTKTDATFVDGMLTEVSATAPSELLAIAKTPVDMLKAVGDGIRSVSPVQVDYTNKEREALAAEAQLLRAQKDLLEAQSAYSKAKAAAEKTEQPAD